MNRDPKARLNRDQIAEACGVTPQAVSVWFNAGLTRPPNGRTLIQWLDANNRPEPAARAREFFRLADNGEDKSASVRLTEAKIKTEQETFRKRKFENDTAEIEYVATALVCEAIDALLSDLRTSFIAAVRNLAPMLANRPAGEIIPALSVGLESAIERFGKGERK